VGASAVVRMISRVSEGKRLEPIHTRKAWRGILSRRSRNQKGTDSLTVAVR
jgi:hypothetical protein